jgi:hypothetical protein
MKLPASLMPWELVFRSGRRGSESPLVGTGKRRNPSRRRVSLCEFRASSTSGVLGCVSQVHEHQIVVARCVFGWQQAEDGSRRSRNAVHMKLNWCNSFALGLQIPADHADRRKYYSLNFRQAEFDASDLGQITLSPEIFWFSLLMRFTTAATKTIVS